MLVYLTIEGQERVALGQTPSTWHFLIREELCDYDKTSIKVGEFTAALPSKETCMAPVLARLKEKEAEINAEAYKELMLIKDRRDALLVLTMEGHCNE